MRGGALWEQQRLVRLTSATASGSLPTPVKYDAHGTWESNNYHGLGWLAAHEWAERETFATPTAAEATHASGRGSSGRRGAMTPSDAARTARYEIFETPTRGMGNGGSSATKRGPAQVARDEIAANRRKFYEERSEVDAKVFRVMERQRAAGVEFFGTPTAAAAPHNGSGGSAPTPEYVAREIRRRNRRAFEETGEFNQDDGSSETFPTPTSFMATYEGSSTPRSADHHNLVETLQNRGELPWRPRRGDGGAFPTPTTSGGLRGGSGTQEHYPNSWGRPGDQDFGQLHPEFPEWLMDWPTGWSGLEPLETGRFLRWLSLHGITSTDSD